MFCYYIKLYTRLFVFKLTFANTDHVCIKTCLNIVIVTEIGTAAIFSGVMCGVCDQGCTSIHSCYTFRGPCVVYIIRDVAPIHSYTFRGPCVCDQGYSPIHSYTFRGPCVVYVIRDVAPSTVAIHSGGHVWCM